ncbi:uncharacterized protein LOC131673317 [Phymastichus coffea]|uniref:uncharacterized protein LOC131673317 n=1 Tax=Phymastichus coffea TaxID=108790 RepID=UPI00273BF91C|nr:uncharacterized protein LOC131673317 [Phymastichus coffea]
MSDDTQPNKLLMFRAAVANSFQDIAHCVSEEEFLQIFTMLESKPLVVKKLHQVMEKDLYKALDNDLQELVSDECMVEGMKKVAKLTEEAAAPADAKLWRPPGNVELHMRSIDADKMIKECEVLEAYISQMDKENEVLMDKINERRKSIQSVGSHMNQLLNMPFKLSELENTVKFNQEQVEKQYKKCSVNWKF